MITSIAAAIDVAHATVHRFPVADSSLPREEIRRRAEALRATFGPRLRAWREHRKMDQHELSFFAGISKDSVRNYEEGQADPSHFGSMVRLAMALGVTLDQLTSQDPPSSEGHVERDPDAPPPPPPAVSPLAEQGASEGSPRRKRGAA